MSRPRKTGLTACIVLALALASPASAARELAVEATESPAARASSGTGESPPLETPRVAARSAILIDGRDGKILWEKASHHRQAVASTGKILTALVVLEKTRPGEIVSASSRAEAVGDQDPLVTQLNLTTGEKLTVEQLLYGLLLPSANDAAVALAEHVGGSIEGFSKMMNAKAKKLGAKDSHFTNPNGLDDPRQFSSAHDLALFARAAMKFPLFRKIVSSSSHAIPQGGRQNARILANRNQLLGRFPGASGIKTGQTLAAGKSLVGAARQGTEERISVVLASGDPLKETEALLRFGMNGFRRFEMAVKSRSWGQITYGDGTSARLVALKDEGVLLPRSVPNPKVAYLPGKKLLIARVDRELSVPVKVECLRKPCRLPPKNERLVMPEIMSLLAPILALTR